MENIIIITSYGLISGLIGTTAGGILGAFLNIRSNKLLSFILEFAAGLMTSIICFNLIPESLQIINISKCIIGILFGIFIMVICNKIISQYYNSNASINTSSLLKTGSIISIGLAVHNFPEGLAIGAGFKSSTHLGFILSLAILIHDIPEGFSVSLPLKLGGTNKFKSILISMLSGLTTGLGAFLGVIMGSVSENFIGVSLAFAAGAMLYIVSCELIPESKRIYIGKFPSFGNILGILLGILSHTI